MLKKTTLQEIKHSFGRYIAIIAIVTLGVGFFAGLKITRTDMVTTADEYLSSHNFYDYQLISTLGFEDVDVSKIAAADDVKAAEGEITADILYESDDAVDRAATIHSITKKINTLQLSAGKMPEKANECLADNNVYSADDIGKTITLSENNNSDDLNKFRYKEYTIVGLCESPLFLNFERGSTSVGNGSVSCFIYIPEAGFDMDCYTSVFVDLDNSDSIYSDAYNDYIDSKEDAMDALCSEAADRRYNAIYDKAKKELDKAKKKYNEGYQDYVSEKADTYNDLDNAYNKLVDGENQLVSKEKSLSANKKKLETSKGKIEAGLTDIATQKQALEANKPYLSEQEYNQSKTMLDEYEANLSQSLTKVTAGLKEIASGEKSIASAKVTLAQNKQKYYDGKATADKEFAKAAAKLDDAKKKIQDGEKELKKIKSPKTYTLDRDTNIGYVCFDNDSSLIDGIAKIFPVFFFLVAALVCMTTMTRMVDEHRTQIGVFKALGYSNGAIMGEYLFYSGSAAFIGCMIGFFGGCYIFPKLIWAAYGMMYDFNPNLHYVFDWKLGLLSMGAALLCSMGSTFLSCKNDLKIVPAELIRPKSPKNGKRILLEYITPLWNHLGFLYKVTLRNIFRYKKRFFMMVLGISGCTALLLTGLGISDSVKNIVNFQYDEIMTYDYSITFDKPMNSSDQTAFNKDSSKYINSIYYLSETTIDFVQGDETKSVKMIVSDGKGIDDFIDLHTSSAPVPYPKNGEAVICNEIADDYNVKIGDTITLRNSDRDTMKVKVSGICENYIYDYVYVTPDTCKDGWGSIPEYKTAFVKATDGSRDGVSQSSADVQNLDNVVATSVNNDMRDRVNSMMTSMDAVILLVILSAGALAFVVLYNLTNINITERIREIATIKVLGFYPNETSAYVFRENFILTGISAIVGLFLGKALLTFVISQLTIDLICFTVRIAPMSYVLSVVLTFVFAIIVSIAMYFKLNKISMTESLKSIE